MALLSTPKIDLVIFDCDGVLVDSEPLSAKILSDLLQQRGFPFDAAIFADAFLGRSFATGAARYMQFYGHVLPDDLEGIFKQELLLRLKGRLKPMPGIVEVLQALKVPFCLATSSIPERLALTLAETGLSPYFVDKAFTASQVKHGKPAPDLVLHAAQKMGFSPSQCLVLEDTEVGLQGALSAQMTAWHFCGGTLPSPTKPMASHVVPHHRLDSMAQVLEAFCQIGIA